MTVALYATIWAALALFAAAEAGRTRLRSTEGPAPWAWAGYTAGSLLAVAHVALALHVRYGWDHALAVSETARQSADVYGFAWRGSIYVSYAFVVAWLIEAWRRRPSHRERSAPAGPLTWALRAFFLIVIVNGAIIFAVHEAGRVAGAVIVAALIWSWTAGRAT